MTKQQNTLTRCLEITEFDKIEGFRYAEIVAIDRKTGFIWVDYPGNPLKRKLPALIANKALKIKDITRTTLNPSVAKITFDEGNPAMPLIQEIFYSLNNTNTEISNMDHEDEEANETLEKTIHIKADRIILEAGTEIIIKSGNVKSVYQGKEGKIEAEADDIRSTARTNNRLRGGSVLIN